LTGSFQHGTPPDGKRARIDLKAERWPAPSILLAILLYVAETAAGLSALAIYKKGARPWASFLGMPAGRILIAASLTLAVAVLSIVQLHRTSPKLARRFLPTALVNVVSVVLMLALLEISLRVAATTGVAGPMVAHVALMPKDWKLVAARNRTILSRATTRQMFLVYDKELGWTVGRSRESDDYNRSFQARYLAQHDPSARERWLEKAGSETIYASSIEGIRSPKAGMSFVTTPSKRRIALIGDSFTFGLEVAYQGTWGRQLELALGSEFQVLNFGVDGYGVDQAYLRFQRDVLPWQPEVTILGIIDDDLRRTMCVYGFLCFPESEIPFPKPRFVLKNDSLVLLSAQLPTPDAIFVSQSITALPLIEHDPAFHRRQWDWHLYDMSYAVRLVRSKFPPWDMPRPTTTEQAQQDLNAELIRAFARTARQMGSTPLVVFFPTRKWHSANVAWPSPGKETLRASGVPFIDMTACVEQIAPADRFVVLHYSAATNAAIAKCLQPALAVLLKR
jgi:hypothetical protein